MGSITFATMGGIHGASRVIAHASTDTYTITVTRTGTTPAACEATIDECIKHGNVPKHLQMRFVLSLGTAIEDAAALVASGEQDTAYVDIDKNGEISIR